MFWPTFESGTSWITSDVFVTVTWKKSSQIFCHYVYVLMKTCRQIKAVQCAVLLFMSVTHDCVFCTACHSTLDLTVRHCNRHPSCGYCCPTANCSTGVTAYFAEERTIVLCNRHDRRHSGDASDIKKKMSCSWENSSLSCNAGVACEVWGCNNGLSEDSDRLGCYGMYFGE